jgi:imidazoleglycerol phosphate dehydratase HisB
MRRFTKYLILWLVLSEPVGIAVGAGFSAAFGDGASLDRFTSAVNGALAGAWLALFGALMAAATITIAHRRLQTAGASNVLTGAIISYGLIFAGLLLLR